MDSAGFPIGVVGLTRQLAKATIEYYKIFDNMNDVGSSYDASLHDLRTQGLLLKGWEQAWGFGNSNYSHQQQRLDPGDYRYRYATATLARIVAVFASVDKLQAKYGVVMTRESTATVEAGGRKARLRDRLSVSLPTRFRSTSPGPSTSTRTAQTPIPGATKDDLHLLENPQLLENKHILPGLDNEITSMTQAMDRVQQSLPIFLKLRWVILDNAKLVELLKRLTSLNDGLFRVLPISDISLAFPANS